MSWRDKIAQGLLDAWFGKSVVTHEGKPLVVYRGEHGVPPESGFQSRLNSLSFGDQNAANTYAMHPNDRRDFVEAPRVTPGYLKIENPIIHNTDDPFVDLSHLQSKLGTDEAMRIARKFDSDIQYTGNWDENYSHQYDNVKHLLDQKPDELSNLYFDAHKYLDDPEEVLRLKQRGFDGAIHMGNGETATDLEYRIFDPANFRTSLKGAAIAAPAAAPAMGALVDQSQYQGPAP
jgi:hypothetical protein